MVFPVFMDSLASGMRSEQCYMLQSLPTYVCLRGSGFKKTLPPLVRLQLRHWVQTAYAGHVIFVEVPEEGGESPDVTLITAVPVRRSLLSSWNHVMNVWVKCIDEYVSFMGTDPERYRQPESFLLNEEDLFALRIRGLHGPPIRHLEVIPLARWC